MTHFPPAIPPFDGQPDERPRLPDDPALRSGVAILGAGAIAQSAHLPAYARYGVGVSGVWSRSPTTTADVHRLFPRVGRVYGSPRNSSTTRTCGSSTSPLPR